VPSPATLPVETCAAPDVLELLELLDVVGLLELLPQPAIATTAPTATAALRNARRPLSPARSTSMRISNVTSMGADRRHRSPLRVRAAVRGGCGPLKAVGAHAWFTCSERARFTSLMREVIDNDCMALHADRPRDPLLGLKTFECHMFMRVTQILESLWSA
jgi:hypothetical protein